MASRRCDAVVVGSGPNGLAAAIVLARAGLEPTVYEARDTIGGGTRSAELTLPGFLHDVCSAIHPLLLGSPFMRELPLRDHGLELAHSPLPLAHPFDDAPPATLHRSVEETARGLGADGAAYSRLIGPLAGAASALMADVLGPLRLPRHPVGLARFGLSALRSATALARSAFETERARGLVAGLAGHSMLPLEAPGTAAFGLILAVLGHAVGWPIAVGGSRRIADALASHLAEAGGEIVTSRPVGSLDELPRTRAVLFDVAPRHLLEIAERRLPDRYRRRVLRYRHGPGAFKLDWALDGPIPWADSECAGAATVHLGGTMAEIAASERAAAGGGVDERPFVILAQQSPFDATRAPTGKHTAWAYCHVPNGSADDATNAIEAQVERFAPGFRERILARHAMGPAELEAHNRNLVGGDVNGGAADLGQVVFRPARRLVPYRTPLPGVYLCSSATPPGGGVHGMCGYFAARAALRRVLTPAT